MPADGIQEHHDNGTSPDRRLHHQTDSRFVDEPRLLQADVPTGGADQNIGVVVTEYAFSGIHLVTRIGRKFADQPVLISSLDHLHQIACTRYVELRQTGW